jgi:hypothetical protein
LRRASRYITDWRESEKVFFALRAEFDLGMCTPRRFPIITFLKV